MKTAKDDERGRRLSRLKTLRLVLIGIAVILAVAIAAVYGLYLHTPAEEPAETVPAITQETVEATQQTLPENTGQAQEDPTEQTQPQSADNVPQKDEPAPEEPEESLPDAEETVPATQTTEPPVTEAVQPEPSAEPEPTEATQALQPEETQAAPQESGEETEPAQSLPETSAPAVPDETSVFVEETFSESTAPAAQTETQAEQEDANREKEELRPLRDPTATTEAPQEATETTAEAMTQENTQPTEPDQPEEPLSLVKTVWMILWVLLGVDLAGIVIVSVMIASEEKKYKRRNVPVADIQQTMEQTVKPTRNVMIEVGMVHNIGARPYQEDSLGMIELDDGALAVVADGMGGLSGGDKVSQKIVSTMLAYGQTLRPEQMDGVLERMVGGVNQEVNRMLGPDGIYKSGSTLLSVLIRRNRFHWITVGDSRIYFYRHGKLVQLNQEHNVGQELLMRAARGEITYEEARSAPKKNRVTSFIGMGNLKYVDKSVQSIALAPGDRILLLTDGIFNALPDQTILAVLNHCHGVDEAAAEMERMIVKKGNPRQDNFTAIILGF